MSLDLYFWETWISPFGFGMCTPPQRNDWKAPSQSARSKSHLLTSKAAHTLNITNLLCCKIAYHEVGRRDEKADIRKTDSGRNSKVLILSEAQG